MKPLVLNIWRLQIVLQEPMEANRQFCWCKITDPPERYYCFCWSPVWFAFSIQIDGS